MSTSEPKDSMKKKKEQKAPQVDSNHLNAVCGCGPILSLTN